MKPNRKLALAVTVIGTALLAACTERSGATVDVEPVRRGLEFLGISGVLGALIVVLGRFIGR